jgi:hypothetical protein
MARDYHHFSGMSWPLPSDRMNDLEDALRYWEDGAIFPQRDRLLMASVLAAYRTLIWETQSKRNAVAKELRSYGWTQGEAGE